MCVWFASNDRKWGRRRKCGSPSASNGEATDADPNRIDCLRQENKILREQLGARHIDIRRMNKAGRDVATLQMQNAKGIIFDVREMRSRSGPLVGFTFIASP